MSYGDLRTRAIVLRRTNYGEADRILNILTPQGKKAVMAKGVRKEKSRLAGGIEMFSISDVVIHEGRGEFAILTSAKMNKFFNNLLRDYARMEAASFMIKKVSRAAEAVDSPEYFEILLQCFEALNLGQNVELIKAWFLLNLVRTSGEQINLYTDIDGEKLIEGENYSWDTVEKSLKKMERGKISTNEIKMLRLMLTAKLDLVLKVKIEDEKVGELLYIAQALNQI